MANTIGRARLGDPLPALSMQVASGYSPADLSFAYGYSRITNGGDGSGQTIAIMIPFATSTNHLQADLDYFSSYYMLPSTTLKIYTPNGTNTPYKDTSQWYAEATLDVEWAHAMAPAASIALIIAPDDYSLGTNSLFECATGTNSGQAGAGVVSMSWANPEDSNATNDWSGIFTNPSVSYVAASGAMAHKIGLWESSGPRLTAMSSVPEQPLSSMIPTDSWSFRKQLGETAEGVSAPTKRCPTINAPISR